MLQSDHLHAELAEGGRLMASPAESPPQPANVKGVLPLGIGENRDGLVYVPQSVSPDEPAALLLLLHGAGGNAANSLRWMQAGADDTGTIVLIPESRGTTWDLLRGGYGPDVRFIDRALEHVFSRFRTDSQHICIGGFSDGASYALSLGITNGNLFCSILAFSPGFVDPSRQHGRPRIFISHGTGDPVLNINQCSRRIVPQLKRAGYDVKYHEFDGGHTIPGGIVQEAVSWLHP